MKRYILSLLFSLLYFTAFACSCDSSRSFCEIVNADVDQEFTIISGEKIRDIYHGMEFRVHQVYQGTVNQSVIKIWGDPGSLCRMYTYTLEDGEELILALFKLGNQSQGGWTIEHEQEGDYVLSGCGRYYAKCSEETEDIAICLGIENICACKNDKMATFYPNPTAGILYSEAFLPSEEENRILVIYDISGKLVKKIAISNQMYQGGRLEINLLGLTTGIYIIDFDFRDKCGKKSKQRVVVL